MGKQILAINAIKQMHLSHISHVQFLLLYLQLLATPSNQSVSMSIDFIAVNISFKKLHDSYEKYATYKKH